MRKALAFVIGCSTALAGLSQAITVKVNGNKNEQVVVDGRTYTIDHSSSVAAKTISITDLSAGKHTIQVNRSGKKKNNAPIGFTTMNGYETMITVTGNGAVQVKNIVAATGNVRVPMNDADFAKLLQRTRNHMLNNSRITAVSNAVSNTSYYFNTSQLRMLLESFTGEVKRLELLKQAYPRVTDPMNVPALSTLFTVQENKNDLAAYVRMQGGDVIASYSESFRTPVAAVRFNSMIESIENQWQEGARLSSIIDVLENSRNYFTTIQALELIRLVADQSSRLHLAKAMYTRLTDPENVAALYSLFDEGAYLVSFKSYITANSNTNITGIHNYGKAAMSDAAFSNMYNSARNHFRTSSVLKEVTASLQNADNYFSSYQARQMILLVKSENDRLQLAKTAYRGIVDPNNFLAQMNDLFNWQSNRDELANYVNAYAPQ